VIGEASFYGMYVPWLLVLAGASLVVHWGVRRLLGVVGLYRWVWHPALFDMALYVLLLYGVARASYELSPTLH
jgi:protein AaeX